MRAPAAHKVLTCQRAVADDVDVAHAEVAILQTHIPVLGERGTHTCDCLPRELGGRIVDTAEAGRHDGVLDVRYADTAADKALKAIVAAEVEQAVDHVAESLRAAAQRTGSAIDRGARAVGDAVSACTAIADFGLKAEAAEVVTHNTANVVAGIALEVGRVSDTSDGQISPFDDHRASIDLDVPGIFLGERRRCERRGRQG